MSLSPVDTSGFSEIALRFVPENEIAAFIVPHIINVIIEMKKALIVRRLLL